MINYSPQKLYPMFISWHIWQFNEKNELLVNGDWQQRSEYMERLFQFQFNCSVLCESLWAHRRQASLSTTKPWTLLKLMSIGLMMPSNHLIVCYPLLFSPSIFPRIRVFSNESVLRIRWPKSWSFSFSISPSNEYSGLISFRMDWLDLLASPRDSQESSPTSQFKSINSSTLSFLYGPSLKSIYNYWENYSFD